MFSLRTGLSLLAAALAVAPLVAANTVTFVSNDTIHRTVYFTPSYGQATLPPTDVRSGHGATVDFPQGWTGNWYSVSEGCLNVPGMLGEVTFNGWNSLTYFDVSAIVNPDDKVGVHRMWPTSEPDNISGCVHFPCDGCYNQPNDIQTKSTTTVDFICVLDSQ